MSEATFVLLSALFLAIPVGIKYLFAFETRSLLASLRQRERAVQQLSCQLEAVERECLVVKRAVRQVQQQRQARERRAILHDKLDRTRQAAGATSPVAA